MSGRTFPLIKSQAPLVCADGRVLLLFSSTSQVVHIMLSVFERVGWVPRFIGYDDACHLHLFLHDRLRAAMYAEPSAPFSSVWCKLIKYTKCFIDKFHISNHVDPWCKENMSPYRPEVKDDLANVNTMVSDPPFGARQRGAVLCRKGVAQASRLSPTNPMWGSGV